MIEVRIFRSELRQFDNEVHSSLKILEALREKGVPTIGTICLLGVREGRLTVEHKGEELVLRWYPPTETCEDSFGEFA